MPRTYTLLCPICHRSRRVAHLTFIKLSHPHARKPPCLKCTAKLRRQNYQPAAEAITRTPPLPPRPTLARPGTPEKLAIMAQRHREGFQLHHPADYAYRTNTRHRAYLEAMATAAQGTAPEEPDHQEDS